MSFVDEYLNGKIADRIGKSAIIVISVLSLAAPNAFAAGTKQFVDEEAKAATVWMQDYLRKMFDPVPDSVPPTPPSATSVPETRG